MGDRGGNAESGPLVVYERRNHVAVLTLNRPHCLNALNPELLLAIAENIRRADADKEVRVIIITGAGKGFCAGADLRPDTTSPLAVEGENAGKQTYRAILQFFNPAVSTIVNSNKPVIAAINGPAAGAGASLALACDFRVMTEDSYILQAFINIGLVPDAGATYFLTRQLGYSKALEIALEGKPVQAKTCLELGLANKVVKKDELMVAAFRWAEVLAEKPPFAVRLTKNAMLNAMNGPLEQTLQYEGVLQQFARLSEDHLEGRKAFLEKRKAKVSGTPVDIPYGALKDAKL